MTDTQALAGRIRRACYQITDAWDDTLEPARRLIDTHAISSLVDPPLPIGVDILDTRRTCHVRLAYWSRIVITARNLHLLADVDVPALAAFLITHVDWLAGAYPKAATELESSATALGVIAADNAPARFRVGACPGQTDGHPCTGTVRATVRADDDMLPSELACDATPRHTWPAGEWRVLERRLHMNEAAARRLVGAILR